MSTRRASRPRARLCFRGCALLLGDELLPRRLRSRFLCPAVHTPTLALLAAMLFASVLVATSVGESSSLASRLPSPPPRSSCVLPAG